MATGTAGTTARDFHTQQTHYIAKSFDYTSSSVNIGTIPAGATITRAFHVVTVAFAGATAATVAIGNAGTTTALVATGTLLTVGVKSADVTIATAASTYTNPSVDTVYTATTTFTGSAETTGNAVAIIEYVNIK